MEGIKTRLSKMEKGKEIISIGTSKDRILEKEIENETELDNFLLQEINYQKWYIKINLVLNEEYSLEVIALVDSGADMNCIKEGLVPTKYFNKLMYKNNITAANGTKMILSYKLKNAFVCNNGICLKNDFIVMKGLSQDLILGKKILFKFITKPRSRKINELKRELVFKENQINFIKEEIKVCNLQTSLENPLIKGKIKALENRMREEICSEIPSAFWERKKHVVRLPFENDFNEKDIPTKCDIPKISVRKDRFSFMLLK
uniref:Peptidase A2 domain-containing protein n=1 Tax=Lactuca sativa TaxID=4236 RepID=A0A9R1XSU5_LACSA|nr:hypothetical protein LSAT_V11C100027930 [Lactuca sativa]